MSAKEELVVECESAGERIGEGVTELQGVSERIDQTQETVSTVMGEEDPMFAAAKAKIEEAVEAANGVRDMINEAIGLIGQAGQQSTL